jgi:hypothetical protein
MAYRESSATRPAIRALVDLAFDVVDQLALDRIEPAS